MKRELIKIEVDEVKAYSDIFYDIDSQEMTFKEGRTKFTFKNITPSAAFLLLHKFSLDLGDMTMLNSEHKTFDVYVRQVGLTPEEETHL